VVDSRPVFERVNGGETSATTPALTRHPSFLSAIGAFLARLGPLFISNSIYVEISGYNPGVPFRKYGQPPRQ